MRVRLLQKVNTLLKDLLGDLMPLILILHELISEQSEQVLKLIAFDAG